MEEYIAVIDINQEALIAKIDLRAPLKGVKAGWQPWKPAKKCQKLKKPDEHFEPDNEFESQKLQRIKQRQQQGVVTAIYYEENLHEIFVGYESGEVELFKVNPDRAQSVPFKSQRAQEVKPK